MVTIITEKLQKQTLDDAQFEPIKQPTRRSCDLTSSPVPTYNFSGKKDCSGDSQFLKHDASHSGRPSRHQIAPLVCIHNVPMMQCGVCSYVFSPPPAAPPTKRHCRSLSIPGDSKCSRKWQPQADTVWRPVPTRPHSAKLLRARHSPLGPHRNKSNEASPIQGYSMSAQPLSPGVGLRGTLTPGSDMFSTPPDSPVPRPASASSGFWDSSQGSLNVTWPDTSPSSLSNRNSAFRFRSLSMEEDPISSPQPPPVSAKPCAAGSMPVIPSHESSAPLSPQRYQVPRCRSQPCVLPERKCGLKRRRDDDRPTIDLFKMKENAYPGAAGSSRVGGSSGAKCVQFACQQDSKYARGMTTSILTEPPEWFLGLNSIASSPLDSQVSLHIQLATPKASPKKAVKFDGAVVDLGRCMFDDADADDDVDTDSGCDDVPTAASQPEMETFVQSELSPGNYEKDSEEVDPLFELEMSSDLDLEQIEKD